MRISDVQQGVIVQQEFAKLVMMGSKGRAELAPPRTDDERRDYEIHVRGLLTITPRPAACLR